MKIIILKTDNGRKCDGGSKVIYEYANYLAQKGNEVYLYFGTLSIFKGLHLPEFIRRPLAIFASKYLRPRWFKFHKKVKKKVFYNMNPAKIENGDVVIATAIETFGVVANLPNSYREKAYFIQDFENWNCSEDVLFESYKKTITKIVVATWLKDIVDKYSEEPSFLVSNGINTDIFHCKNAQRKKHSIVFHYRSAGYKGARFALDAIKILKEKYDDLSVDVISIEKRPVELPHFCRYHHNIVAQEVAEINNSAEVFMCTSLEEGFGLPGLEAMACGCAVASFSYRGVLEYAVNGENALLSPVGDVDALVANIEMLFEDDKMKNKIVKNGLKTGMARSFEQSAKRFEQVLVENLH